MVSQATRIFSRSHDIPGQKEIVAEGFAFGVGLQQSRGESVPSRQKEEEGALEVGERARVEVAIYA